MSVKLFTIFTLQSLTDLIYNVMLFLTFTVTVMNVREAENSSSGSPVSMIKKN